MNRNYMVLKPGPGKNEEYTVRMLTENRIPGFLPFREKQVDGERWFYYDVTSRQPLGRILEHRNLRGKELERLAADLLFSLQPPGSIYTETGHGFQKEQLQPPEELP